MIQDLLYYPDDVNIPEGIDIVLFRNRTDGYLYYKKSNGESIKLTDDGNGTIFNIPEPEVGQIFTLVTDTFYKIKFDTGLAIKFFQAQVKAPENPFKKRQGNKIIYNSAPGSVGPQGAQGAQGPQGASGVTQDALVLHSNQNTNASIGVTNAETTLATFTILANEMGANGYVEIYSYWTVTVSGNAKTVRLKFGGTTYKSFNVGAGAANTAAVSTIVLNRNNVASQVGPNSDTRDQYVPSGTGVITSLVNTAAPVIIEITGQKAVAGETMTLNWAYVLLAHKS